MPVAPPPMSSYKRLHDPVAHAKSEHEAKEAYSAITVDPLSSSSYGAFARRPATVSDTSTRRSRRSKGSSGLGLSERHPNRPHSVNGSCSSGDSFFDKTSSRCSSRRSARDRTSLDPAGSTGWRFRSGGFREKPRYRTQGELQAARAKALLPDPSFDVDGDGVVSSTDYYLSSQFDVDKDGHIDDEERAELRKTMVEALVRKYRAVPKVEDRDTSEMIKAFTRDLDKTVKKSTFMHEFNKLYKKTASAQALDSTQMFGILCPEQAAAHEKRKGGATAQAQASKTTAIAARLIDEPTRASARDTLMIGSQQQRWGGLASRQELLKTRRQQKEDAARQWNHDHCATFPAPGCVRQHVPIHGPPGVRPSNHHRTGYHAPLL